jgi:DNA polymerase-3 subunit delta
MSKIMIIFLYGEDTFRSFQKLNEIINHYKEIHKSGLNLRFIDLKEEGFQEFKDSARTISMFDEKKLLILKNASSNKNFQEDFLENSKYFLNSDDIFLFFEEGVPESNKFFKFLDRKVKSQEFKILEGTPLKNWVKKEFEKYGAKIESSVLDELIEFVGNDLWQMENEIKKLVSFKNGKIIKKEDVESLIKPKIETDIFETVDAISSKNKKRALELLHNHLEKGDSPLYLLSMINFQFRNLLIMKDLTEKGKPYYTFQKTTGLHPFVIKKSCAQAQRFSLLELKKIYQKIFQVDLDIKTGKLDPQAALDLFIAQI